MTPIFAFINLATGINYSIAEAWLIAFCLGIWQKLQSCIVSTSSIGVIPKFLVLEILCRSDSESVPPLENIVF